MQQYEKEHISISRKILLIFFAVFLIQIFLFAISLSLATTSLIEDVTYLRINDFLKSAEFLDDKNSEYIKEIPNSYIESVVITINEEAEDKYSYSDGLSNLVSATQLQSIIDEAYVEATRNQCHYGYIPTSFSYIYYGFCKINDNMIVIGVCSDAYLNSSMFNLITIVVVVCTLIYLMGAAIILFWAHSVVHRLNKLCAFVVEMPDNDYKNVYLDDGDDEIYTLSQKINDMRRTILNDTAAKHAMLQNVSHDLKTPVAVIKSYAEAIEDGIEDISSTNIIIEQCNKLEKKIKRFIEFNKLEYLNIEKISNEVYMRDVIEELVHNLKYLTSIQIQTDLDDSIFVGRHENYYVICENIVENAIRYAKKTIKITLKDGILTFFNDGKPIDQQFINQGFKPYEKGSEGKFGLGMSIVSRTLDIFGMQLIVENVKKGVLFTIKKK